MIYIVLLILLLLLCSLVSWGMTVAPAPMFGTLGLVLLSSLICWVLMGLGGAFLSLVLFMIYLGGMVVVFGFAVSLSIEGFPAMWASVSWVSYLLLFLCVVLFCGVSLMSYRGFGIVGVEGGGFYGVRVDVSGVVLLYSFGGASLLACGGVLVLCLLAVLELARGRAVGGLRAL